MATQEVRRGAATEQKPPGATAQKVEIGAAVATVIFVATGLKGAALLSLGVTGLADWRRRRAVNKAEPKITVRR